MQRRAQAVGLLQRREKPQRGERLCHIHLPISCCGLHSSAASRLAQRHSQDTVRFRTNPHYEGDLARCRRQQVAFLIMAERSKLEWWFTGSILLLAISILGFAYLFWE